MISDLITKAPEETYNIGNRWVTVRREDLAYKKPLPPNAKMSALYEIVKAHSRQYREMILFAKKQTGISYSIGFPYICKEFNIHPVVVYPKTVKTKVPDWFDKLGPQTETYFVHPNMVTINVNQCKQLAEERKAFFVPFGFDHQISVRTHSERFDLPRKIGTLIMATMTGMTLAGAIDNLYRGNKPAKQIIGVSCGRDENNVMKSMSKYINVPDNVKIINPYERHFKPNIETPFPLHPDYELKAWNWMIENIDTLIDPIYFVNVGA